MRTSREGVAENASRLTESPRVRVEDVREVSQAHVHIDEDHVVRTLARVCGELEHRELERTVERWVSGAELRRAEGRLKRMLWGALLAA